MIDFLEQFALKPATKDERGHTFLDENGPGAVLIFVKFRIAFTFQMKERPEHG
ncbi:hypothetical protein D3C71_1951900 [compost metagenome]